MTKLAIICAAGLDNFLQWAAYLPGDIEAKVFPIRTQQDIEAAVAWGDVLWFEWANEVAIAGTQITLRKPAIVRLHSYEAFGNMPSQITWTAVNSLVYVADHVREIAERYNHIPPHVRTAVIPNGVDLETIPDLNPGPGHDIAVVGGISHKKSPELVLQIASMLTAEYRIHWAGAFQDLRYEVYLKHMAKTMKLENRVKFYGHVTDMNEFWKGKNYLLQTSVHEGHSLAILEAMARNIRPVIHSYYGAREQYYHDWLFESCQEAADMIASPAYGGAYRECIVPNGWTLQNQAARIHEVIQEAMR